MNDQERTAIIELANTLSHDHDPRIVACANMLLQYRQAYPVISSSERNDAIQTAGMIYDIMADVDEPRFSMHDYMDAVANAAQAVDLEKLNALDSQAFAAAMIWLATYKRETYEDQAHIQGPLELDIWREP